MMILPPVSKHPVLFPVQLLVALLLLSAAGCKSRRMFEAIGSGHSGIHFNNRIQDNDTLNVLDVENIYNGGGIGIGDFNNDGLQDLYFTGNNVPNKLYLNQGDFRFRDVTEAAGVTGDGRWSRGVSVVDINSDGLQDLYVCATLLPDRRRRENLLYINRGPDASGVPRFSNQAQAYGLDDTSHSTMAAFFDYDNDGDQDLYLLVNELIKSEYPNQFRPVLTRGEHPSTGKLFRNDWDSSLRHPVFTDVSVQAGVTIEGYGHGVTITDINRDGWQDIFVTNDFLPNNLLYINQGNGTFANEAATYFKHSSENAMGQDVVDINNDGLVDVIELDMNPEDNFRKKMMLNPLSYQRYQNNDYYGYQYQYVRNVLQLNQGPRVGPNDSIGPPVFSEVAFYAGIAETDWSWAPVVIDFDNDGFRDLLVTNGFPKDVSDHDFIAFRNKAYSIAAKKDLLEQIPEVKIPNYLYRNNGDLTFSDVTKEWDMAVPTFSSGAVYADLDRDGDMDVVINNINDEALLYRNNARELDEGSDRHYLQVQLAGDTHNRNGLGAWIELYYAGGKKQVYENTPYRGYLSSMQPLAHFGLGTATVVDSLVVRWPGGKVQRLQGVKADQLVRVDIAQATEERANARAATATGSLFRDVTAALNLQYIHHDSDFVDFNIQRLLPHKFSEFGPALAAGDVDGNGLDDLVSGGSFFYEAQVFLQQPGGQFVQKGLQGKTQPLTDKKREDLGMLLLDADSDGDLDLYIASGGFEAERQTPAYGDRLYLNDGRGGFSEDSTALPPNFTSKFCARASDYDHDGDLDLFVAGRVDPWHYPRPVSSFLLRNDSRNGKAKFTDVTATVARDLVNIGLVCDAVFTDFDNDGWHDLVLAGEWMPVTFLKNDRGTFRNGTAGSGVDTSRGWWNTLAPADFDNDGDIDYVVGNLGKNSFYRGSSRHPVGIFAGDFDENGSYDAVPYLYLPETLQDPERKPFPAHIRDDMIKQMISMRLKFPTYRSYATATINEVLTEEQRKKALQLQATYLASGFLRNEGHGRFTLEPLPLQAQLSVLCGMVADDFNGDGNMDVLINGNDYGTEVSVGRYDALNGLLLQGDGKGGFKPLTILESGIFIPGNGKALVSMANGEGQYLVAASQNKGPLKVFALKRNARCLPLLPGDRSAIVRFRNGAVQKREFYYGASFLSQSARYLLTSGGMASVEVTDDKGNRRRLPVP